MAENSEKKEPRTADKKEPVPEAPPKKSGPGFLGMLLPALLAGGAAFGGTRLPAAHASAAAPAAEHEKAAPPPGPTVPFEPFLVVTADANGKPHGMKVTIAVEFSELAKEETLKSFTPRIRDASLGYFRTMTYEDGLDSRKSDKIRTDLLERCRATGATQAERVLITDLVLQ
jgi:flagellar basal body-associated protein FliL